MNEEGIVMAYIGPGAGLASIGALLTLIGAVGLMVLGFIWYPVKRVVQKWRERRAEKKSVEPTK